MEFPNRFDRKRVDAQKIKKIAARGLSASGRIAARGLSASGRIAAREIKSAGRYAVMDSASYLQDFRKAPLKHKRALIVAAAALSLLGYKINTRPNTVAGDQLASYGGLTDIQHGQYCYDSKRYTRQQYRAVKGEVDAEDSNWSISETRVGDELDETECEWKDAETGMTVVTSYYGSDTFGTWTNSDGQTGVFELVPLLPAAESQDK